MPISFELFNGICVRMCESTARGLQRTTVLYALRGHSRPPPLSLSATYAGVSSCEMICSAHSVALPTENSARIECRVEENTTRATAVSEWLVCTLEECCTVHTDRAVEHVAVDARVPRGAIARAAHVHFAGRSLCRRRQRRRHVAQLDEGRDRLEALVNFGGVLLVLCEARLVAVEFVVQLPEHFHLQLHYVAVDSFSASSRFADACICSCSCCIEWRAAGPTCFTSSHSPPAHGTRAAASVSGARVRSHHRRRSRAPQAFNSFQPSLSSLLLYD